MKITIYELLGMIKDGKAPKKIKQGCEYYDFIEENNDYSQKCSKNYYLFSDKYDIALTCRLNDEVEIIEEEKKDNFTGWKMYQDGKEVCSMDYSTEEEKKIPEKLEDISEIKCVGCKVEINIVGNKTLFDTDTPIVTEHCIYKINQLIKNQKKIINYLKSKGE